MNNSSMNFIRAALVAIACLGSFSCGPRGSFDDLLREGLEALRNDQFRHAERRLRAAVSQRPENVTAVAHLALAQWKRGSLSEAVESMRKAVVLEPDNVVLREYLGLFLLRSGEYGQALPVLENASRADPDNVRLLTAMAVARWRLGNTAAAADLLANALRRRGEYPPAIYNLALFQLEERQDKEQAKILFERYKSLEPSGEMAGEVRKVLRRLERETARIKTHTDPRAVPVPRSPFQSSSPRLLNLANVAVRRGDIDEAYIHLREAISEDEHDAHAFWVMSEFKEQHLQSPERTVRVLRDFLERFPDDPRVDEARRRLRRLVADDKPDEPPPLPQLSPHDVASAWLDFTRPRRRDRESAHRAYQRGLQYAADADWERAGFFLKRSIEADDEYINAFLQLAMVYENSGDFREALAACRHALQLNPALTAARMRAVRLLVRLGAAREAVSQLHIVLDLEPGHADAHLWLGLLLGGDPETRETGSVHLRRYLELEPEGPRAADVRRRLDDWER